jgi:adenylate cyclase class 2
MDQTPIGNFCEIEGPSRWIDETAKKLGVNRSEYITKNYATLFTDWKKETNSAANEMTFKAVGEQNR